ncbi:hypothetical protein AZE42_05379 [Rhizopogon vesiculosus]|uniref:F-box domain-containing protein n=1 Tax=Rhizopogon vesiculosus TaxID=180088 RepID=A0A1J8R9N9_9AGAM|nr:hypothetical protein AZE42_05379 [Rhizopogon vesiculosus]
MQVFRAQDVEPLSDHEARQFLRHAARVRSLHILDEDSEYFHLLTAIPTETCQFQRLLALEYSVDGTIRHLPFFLSITLRRCVLSVVHPDLKYCYGLESLSLWGSTDSADEPSLLSKTICSCKSLKHLRCPLLDSTGWNHLSNLPTLVTLRIYGWRYEVQLDWDNLNVAPFVNVATLQFNVYSAADVIKLIQHSEFPSLEEFSLCTRVLPWVEAEQLFRALSQCRACETLECIYISSSSSHPGHEKHSLTAIRQFICFSQLRALRLSVHGSIYLDNDLLLDAMSSWPHIRSLKLADTRVNPPAITFRGLFAALRLCPNLLNLQIYLDAVNIDIDPEAELFQHTSLRELDICNSNVEDPKAVAYIIFSMFPCISSIISPLSSNRRISAWDEVKKELKSLRSSVMVQQGKDLCSGYTRARVLPWDASA